jgi:hypothetical protein
MVASSREDLSPESSFLFSTPGGLHDLMLRLTSRIHTIPSLYHPSGCADGFRGEALGRETPRKRKTNKTTTCVPRNGGPDCVGVRALSTDKFMASRNLTHFAFSP